MAKEIKQPDLPVEPLVSFDIWFVSTGKPAHHVAGMKAFADTSGRKTPSNWANIFKSY